MDLVTKWIELVLKREEVWIALRLLFYSTEGPFMEVKKHRSHSIHSFVQLICILCQHYCGESCLDFSEETVQRGLWTSKEQVTIGYEAFCDRGMAGKGGVCSRGHEIWNGGAAAEGPGQGLRMVLASWTVTWSGLADHEESYVFLAKDLCPSKENLAAPKPSRTCCQQVQIISFKLEWLLSALLPSWNNDLKGKI